jgi:putative component of membrane protein insertase Oxa1/YidC/SpoIIIJ protein YidD
MRKRIKHYKIALFFALIFFVFCAPVWAQEPEFTEKRVKIESAKTEDPDNFVLFPVYFFRKYISNADDDRCPMHPTCSTYCIEAIKKHGPVLGWIMTCDRLIRCGRDEMKLSPPIWFEGKKRCYDPLSDNDFWLNNK